MAAAAVRPVQRPQTLRRRALLQQQLTVAVENEQRERPMQDAPAVMALGLAEVSYFAVGFIYEDEGFGIGGDFDCAAATLPNFIRHKDKLHTVRTRLDAQANRGLRHEHSSLHDSCVTVVLQSNLKREGPAPRVRQKPPGGSFHGAATAAQYAAEVAYRRK